MEARLERLAEAIRSRAGALEPDQRRELEGKGWLMAGAWWNGNNRGWVNRGWPNRVQGGSYYRTPQMWANFRPGWGTFRNGPRFINW
jgi:rSAM-associated Gly-rich repeat protein